MAGHRTDNEAVTRYATARRAGDLLYLAGVSGRGADNVIPGVTENADGTVSLDMFVQTIGCFKNLEAQLTSHGLTLEHLVDLTCYLTNMDDYMRFVDAFNKAFDGLNAPPRTTIGVASLPDPKLCIEIKGVACFSDSRATD